MDRTSIEIVFLSVGIYWFLTTFKSYLSSIVIAFLSSGIKSLQENRKGEGGSFSDFWKFGLLACVITLTALGIMQYMGMKFDFIAMVIMFWLGVFSDYLYGAIGKLLEVLGGSATEALGEKVKRILGGTKNKEDKIDEEV